MDQLLRTRKLYNILTHAILDGPFRESLFRSGGYELGEWDLTAGELACLKKLPYAAFEQMVGRMVSHWLVPMTVNNHYVILPESAGDIFNNEYIPIRLTGSLVFGNAAHATSRLCLAALP